MLEKDLYVEKNEINIVKLEKKQTDSVFRSFKEFYTIVSDWVKFMLSIYAVFALTFNLLVLMFHIHDLFGNLML